MFYTPEEIAKFQPMWQGDPPLFPGRIVIGSNGGRERIVIDVRLSPAPVLLFAAICIDDGEAIPQLASIEELIARVEDGTFDYRRGR
jgi:hypothetical protein